MSSAPQPPTPRPTPPSPAARPLDFTAALFSYFLPGLGQVLQGRIGKGVLFFVCIYSLFFYGFWLGKMKNVWIPESSRVPEARLQVSFGNVRFLDVTLGGIAKSVWNRPQFASQFWMGVAVWPALAQYVVSEPAPIDDPQKEVPPMAVLKDYMQAPTEAKFNDFQRAGDKTWDLAWIYTVIAGVLNLLVIYDALAGPVVRIEEEAAQAAVPTGGAA
ncbi:MAG: DUF6677 family protein [Fimbriiglobus sp.]